MNEIDLRRIDLNLLVVFHALMQEGSVTRAAAKLKLTQSAVSAALARLRTLFNDQLFERSRTGMLPTWRALDISSRLGPALSSISDVVFGEPEFDPRESTRVFHLAMSDDIELPLAPWLANKKINSGWSVEFAIHQTNSTLWRDSVDETRIDLALTATPNKIPDQYSTEALFSGGYLCLYNPQLLFLSEPVTFAEYVSADHVRVSYDVQRGWVDQLLAVRGHKRRVICSVSHFSALTTILQNVPAIATFPEHAARFIAANTNLRLTPAPLQAPRYMITAVWNSRVHGTLENTWLRQILREFSQSLLGTGTGIK